MRQRAKWPWAWMVAVAMATVAVPAGAEPTAADRATARALFDEARALVTQSKHAEACPKFEESQRLDPGVGTMFNLADCYEGVGRTATAWTTFLEVASKLRAEGQAEREKAARERAAALEPKLARLSVMVPEAARIPGLVVRRDGGEVGAPVWGSAVPVDPGKHTIEASAPGKKKWAESVEVGASARISVTVPALQDEPAAATAPVVPSGGAAVGPAATAPAGGLAVTPPSADADKAGDGSTQRLVGLIVGGAGVIGLGVGGLVGLGAKSKFDDSGDYCIGNRCSQQGVDLRSDAVSQGNTATIIGGLGLAAMVGGAVLYFTAPSGKKRASSNATTVGLGPGSIVVGGKF
ncbi:MAG TPA: hypothetical protein PLI95_03075 [Polyangiaceae bacterium]|nr:hypothetical protein [Polyangiaceae bacterium]